MRANQLGRARVNGPAGFLESRDVVVELNRVGVAEVDTSARRRAEYSTDASNYRVVPQVVVFPRHTDEVIAALDVAARLGVPYTARGAGTSTAGNSIGSGIVVDFTRYLARVLAVDPEARTATVQPGAILDSITAATAGHRLHFGPDPSTHARASIGGSLGNNACGSRALAYGRTADNVLALDIVTATGRRIAVGRQDRAPTAGLLRDLDEIISGRLAVVRSEFGRFVRQVSGYSLEHLLPENGRDVARFLVGSEGTLAVILNATVALADSPAAVALAVLGYPDMPSAADAVPGLLPHHPVALEGMDTRLIEMAHRRRGAIAVPDLPVGNGWLLVETAGGTEAEAVAAAKRLVADAGCLDSAIVTGMAARELWRIREDGAGLGGRTLAGAPAWPGWEDAAVPPTQLGAYLREFEALLTSHGVDGAAYGHFGDGCVHARIDFPLSTAPHRFREFVVSAAELVGRYGGSMSGEHGDGRARSELLSHMYSAEAISTFAAIKALFDPRNVLNPGVIVDPAPVHADLRMSAARSLSAETGIRLGFAYPADRGDLSTAVHRCVGIGKCRADAAATGAVMCPSYLATGDEKDSTRGRARVLQELANGRLVKDFRSDEVAEALDLCLSCKGCLADCPAGVDMATYKAEVLYQRYRWRVRPASHYSLGWLPRWARLASRTPRLANASLRRPQLAAIAKRMGGIDARRQLPTVATTTFRHWFADRPAIATGQPVLLWVDTFTDHFCPEVGQAAVAVLEENGYRVQIPAGKVCCGLTWISTGQLDGARRRLRRSLRVLEGALSDGTPIVGLEPSCTAVLRHDVTRLLPDEPNAQRLSGLVRTLAELLQATPGWTPPDLNGRHAVAQPHCHQYAVMGWSADSALLARTGLDVSVVGGCCGLAGNFGVERGHYEVSVAVAETALLPAVRAAGTDAMVLADGFSCRTQLEQLSGIRGIHLAQLLATSLARRAL